MSEVQTSIDGQEATSAIVRFYDGKVFMNDDDRRDAIREGRMHAEDPDFHVVPFIKVQFPGRSDLVVERMAITETIGDAIGDHERFPREWRAYQSQTEAPTGTPLTEVASFGDGDIAHLHNLDIRSVEGLAGLTDTSVANLGMGMRRYRDMARDWLESRPRELDAQTQNEIDALRAELAEMRALLPKQRAKEPTNA